MRLTIKEMRMDDLLHMELRDQDVGMLARMDDWVGNVWEMKNKGYAHTLYHEDKVVACVGVMHVIEGVAEIWAITGKLVEKYPKDFHKTCLKIIKDAITNNNLRRLHCTAEAEYDRTIKWLERLGFEREGTLRNYTSDGKDMYIYSIIRKGDE